MAIFDDLQLLRAFVSIVENNSISGAARSLKVAQPTVSRQLASLEEKCGVALVRRDTHSMNLTEAGHRFLADARAILLLAEESEQRMRQEQKALQGHIRVFATIDSGQSVISRMVASFIQANPAVTISLSLSNRPLYMIQEGCDAGVISGEITDESVIARPLGKITRHILATPAFLDGRPVVQDPAELADWPWISLSGNQWGDPKEVTLHNSKGEERRFSISPVMTSEGVTSMREATRMDLGVAVLPDWLVQEDVVSGRLVRVLPDWQAPAFPANVVYPGQRMLPARVRAFIEFTISYMGAVLKQAE
jgi:DNA-binding transcriptional LysR family regulator